MTPYIRALRAITATVFQRVYRFVAAIIAITLLLLWVLSLYLGLAVSGWWFLLFAILVPLTIIVVVIATILWLLSQRLLPRTLEKAEKAEVLAFSDKILRVAEVRATPLPIMLFLIAKDIVRGKKSSFVEGVIADSSSLKADFTKIKDRFV